MRPEPDLWGRVLNLALSTQNRQLHAAGFRYDGNGNLISRRQEGFAHARGPAQRGRRGAGGATRAQRAGSKGVKPPKIGLRG